MVEDDLDLEDDDFMKDYQAKRLAEMKDKAMQHKFSGEVYEINKQEYEYHTKNMPTDTLGVILMYQE